VIEAALQLTPNLDTGELWRLLALVDLLVLFTCGAYLHLGYRDDVPAHLWRVGIAYAIFLGTVAVGLTANWLSPIPPTPGSKILAVIGAGCALYVLNVTVRVARRQL